MNRGQAPKTTGGGPVREDVGTIASSSRADLHVLVARDEIKQVLSRYCRGVDRRDWAEVATCYHEDAVDCHGTFDGGIIGMLEWFEERHAAVDTSIHFLGNVHIEVNGNRAVGETYFFHLRRLPVAEVGDARMAHQCPDGACESDLAEIHMYGRYLDKFELRDETMGWRIASRQVVADARTLRCAGSDIAVPTGWVWGTRDPSDASHDWFATANRLP